MVLIKMNNKPRFWTVILFFTCFSGFSASIFPVFAQRPFKSKLELYQDTLKKLGIMVVNGADETDRKAATYRFIPTLVRALKQPGSFDFPFDSVKSFRVVYSPDRKFRIITWFVNINDIAYRFYGAIQMNNPKTLQLYSLVDYTDHIRNPKDTITGSKKWFGAEYYSILPPDEKGNYILLGWKGVSDLISSRIIDVVHFDGNNPVFGAPIFKYSGKPQARVIFSYTRQATMMLKYLPEKHIILFDHLSPPDTTLKGKPEYYGPDLTYDAFSYSVGLWNLEKDLKLSNSSSSQDSLFIQPVRKPKIN